MRTRRALLLLCAALSLRSAGCEEAAGEEAARCRCRRGIPGAFRTGAQAAAQRRPPRRRGGPR
jgi:hypothetical protein